MKKVFFNALFLLFAVLLEGQTPRLVVPIGHVEGINYVSFMSDGKTVMTSSIDGRSIFWDLSGRELEYSNGEQGASLGVSFSPDGKMAIVKNAFGDTVIVSDWPSGKILQTFTADQSSFKAAAFSFDGNSVLTVNEDGMLRQWDLAGQLLTAIKIQEDLIASVSFAPDRKSILTCSMSGSAKQWDLSGRLQQTFTGHADKIKGVVFSSDGKTLLAGGRGARLWDLSGRGIQAVMGHTDMVEAVAFSLDGNAVLTCGADGAVKQWDLSGGLLKTYKGFQQGSYSEAVFSPDREAVFFSGTDQLAMLFDLSTGQTIPMKGADNEARKAAFSPDGKLVLTGGIQGARLWDLSGVPVQSFNVPAEEVNAVAFSPDGRAVATDGGIDPSFKVPQLWDLSWKPLQAFGQGLESFETHRFLGINAMVFSQDGNFLLSAGGDATAKLWDVSGRLLNTFEGHRSNVLSVDFSPDGKIMATGSDDHTLKIWDIASGRELATLIALDSADWVVTTPNGFFDASPGAMELMYFLVNREVIDLEQLKERYYEPGLLSKVMGFSDEPLREVDGFDSVALYPAVSLRLDTLQNKLHIRLAPRNGGVGKISVFVNGKEILEEANPPKGFDKARDTTMVIDLKLYARYFLPDSLNEVSVRAYNAEGWLKSAPYSVEYRPVFAGAKGNNQDSGAVPARLEGAPNLFILSVGTANYAGTKIDLKYAAKDALDMAGALEQIGKKMLDNTPGKVFSYVLVTGNDAYPAPTKANIRQAFESINKDAKAADLLLVYFSGHGVAKGDEFYYLTQDMSSFEVEIEGKGKVISNTELTRWINNIPALKQVLILDACNSGKVVESLAVRSRGINSSQIRALEQLKDRTGMFVLTGAAADKVSYEASQFGQGLLTYSLLEGIKGEVPDDKYGLVDVLKLFQYACERVPELARGIGGIQTPVPVGPLGKSFAIGITDSTVHIPLEQEKAVFIRNVFLDEERFDDGLGLTNALKAYLTDQTALGEASFIYLDVAEYEDAYSIKGLYKVTGEEVQVRARLFKGKKTQDDLFTVKGNINNLAALVEMIVEQASAKVD